MSGKIGRKDFKTLFGADDSDEDNFQEKNQNTAQFEVDTFNNHNDSKHKSESLYKSSNTSELDKSRQNVHNNDTKKRSNDLEEIVRNKKRIKSNDEGKEFNITEEKLSNDIKIKDSEKEQTEGLSNENSTTKNVDDKKTRLKKMEVGGLVVKLLTPAYVERRFESKETFKTLARNISHALANKDEQEIREYIRNFLSRNEEFTSQTTL